MADELKRRRVDHSEAEVQRNLHILIEVTGFPEGGITRDDVLRLVGSLVEAE
jgi:hypothetical protein